MRRTITVALICAGVLLVCTCVALVTVRLEDVAGHGISLDPDRLYRVRRIIDGDTIVVRSGLRTVTVRLLGIDTPETVDPRKPPQCYGPEASAETKRLLAGRGVRLAESPDRESRDKYGRYLAYAYRDDGLFVNEQLLEGGFAREYTFGSPYSLQSEFRGIEKAAREGGRGLWRACRESGR